MKTHYLLLLSILFGCSTNDTTEVKEIVETEQSTKIEKSVKDTVIKEDSITIPEFEIELVLSESAKQKTKEESIIVQAYFEGIPLDTSSQEYQEMGKIGVGSKRIELWNTTNAVFKDVKLSNKTYNSLADKNFEVLINVFSGRHTDPNNLLDSEILHEKIDDIKGKKYQLKCKLIYND